MRGRGGDPLDRRGKRVEGQGAGLQRDFLPGLHSRDVFFRQRDLDERHRNIFEDANQASLFNELAQLFAETRSRDNSADSRIATAQGGVGLLPVADLIGRAEGIVASWDTKTKEQPIWTWPFGLRGARFFTAVH